ncbi:hypothetical protein C8J57DRAFT_1043313 [Mycena rebaudengoi]|nr:hypothetical protein C8J57DRAFT_1043313 [Mycena rebaudengoi]
MPCALCSAPESLLQVQGNAAFKAGEFAEAIGHYTAAILADRTDATFPLNRAAAYLKLGKNEDAERDCGMVLALSSTNVKALFRRAQARVAMGKLNEAQADLKAAAKLEPANQSVKQEATKVAELLEKASQFSTHPYINQATTQKPVPVDPSAPKRRRIPITIVEADGTRTTPASSPKSKVTSSADDIMKPVSSRALNNGASTSTPKPAPVPIPTATPAPTPTPTQKPATFKDAKAARESAKPSRAGGAESAKPAAEGAKPARTEDLVPTASAPTPTPTFSVPAPTSTPLSASTATPISTSTSTSAPTSISPSAPPAVPPTKSPMTLFDFTRAWEACGEDAGARWALFCRIPPSALPSLFQTSLEPALFVQIMDVFTSVLASSTPPTSTAITEPPTLPNPPPEQDTTHKTLVTAYMQSFPRVARFATVLRFLSRAERGIVRGVWGALGVHGGEGADGVWGVVW